jgi:[protein-PII] uridylyltransferase
MEMREQELLRIIQNGRRALLATPLRQVTGQGLLEEHARMMDETLRRIYQVAWERAMAQHAAHFVEGETEVALLATGGYGRKELSPFSDIDIAFVPSEEDNPFIDAVIKEAFRLIVQILIDGMKLDVGYGFRTVSDCPTFDHETKTSLLDGRLIIGSRKLFTQLRRALLTHIDAVAFLQEKSQERRNAPHRARASLYALEPHLKEGVGGLRDVHAAMWMAQAMFLSQDRDPLMELERQSVVSAEDCRQLVEAREFLWSVRNYLHLRTQRKTDVLLSDLHDGIARDFRYDGKGAQPAQQFLADYYRHAEHIHHFLRKVTRRLMEGTLPLDAHFQAVRQRIQAVRPHVLWENPARALRVFEYVQRYGFEVDAELDRLIEDVAPMMDDEVRASPEAREAFLAVLNHPSDAGNVLRQMRERGVLQRFVPELEALTYYAPADPSHELTVGEHSLVALDYLGALLNEGRNGAASVPYDAAADVTDWEVMSLGVLLHDVGKLDPQGDHCITGAAMARHIGERLGLEAHRIALLEKLVREHLLLPRASRLRDIDSPATIREIAATVGDATTLKMLYLLSHVDTRAVGNRSYSNMDLRHLDELYQRTLSLFADEENTDWDARATRERERVRRELQHLLTADALRQLCDTLPASYVVNTPLPTIAVHLKLLDRLPIERVIADFYHAPGDDFTELTICAYDDPEPGILSKICGTLFANDVDIHTARVHTLGAEGGIVLDTLWVTRDHRPVSERLATRLGNQLKQVLLGEISVAELLDKAGKKAHPVHVEKLEIRNDLSDDHTVVHIVTEDVQGLLYAITRNLAALGLDIHTAKITSWAGKAEDAFYVTTRDGGKVPPTDVERLAAALKAGMRG